MQPGMADLLAQPRAGHCRHGPVRRSNDRFRAALCSLNLGVNGVPQLRVIQSEWMAGLSTIELIFAPGTDLIKARQMVRPARVEVTLDVKIKKMTLAAKAERLGIVIDDVRTDASHRRIVTYASVLYDLTGTTRVCISADPLTFVRGAVEIDALITCT
jgi:hypothetical protein